MDSNSQEHVLEKEEFINIIETSSKDENIVVEVPSSADAEKYLKLYELLTTTRFIIRHKHGSFCSNYNFDNELSSKSLIRWSYLDIPNDGSPFTIIGSKKFECQYGTDWDALRKLKRKQLRDSENQSQDSLAKKPRLLKQSTKKVACPAFAYFVEILRFELMKLDVQAEDFTLKKKECERQLRNQRSEYVKTGVRTVYIIFPALNSHSNHQVGHEAEISQRLDPRIIERIHSIVQSNPSIKASDVQQSIKKYVVEVLEPESITTYSRRFHPRPKDIENHIAMARAKYKQSLTIQENTIPQKPVQENVIEENICDNFVPENSEEENSVQENNTNEIPDETVGQEIHINTSPAKSVTRISTTMHNVLNKESVYFIRPETTDSKILIVIQTPEQNKELDVVVMFSDEACTTRIQKRVVRSPSSTSS